MAQATVCWIRSLYWITETLENKVQILLLKVNSLPLGKIIVESFTFDLYRHSVYCFDIIIARGLSFYQVTTVHLVTHMSLMLRSSWPRRGLWSPWTLRDSQRLTPPQNAASQEKFSVPFFSGACSPVRLLALILTCSFYAFLFAVFIYFKKKEKKSGILLFGGTCTLGLASLSPE